MKGQRVRIWIRVLVPIAAWVALAVAAAHRPGWAAEAVEAVAPVAVEETAQAAQAEEAAQTSGRTQAPESGRGGGAAATQIGGAGAGKAATVGPAPTGSVRRPPILYVPPSRGHAWRSAGAGTRGRAPTAAGTAGAAATGARPRIAVLAPRDHVGRTENPSPTLYWFLSAPSSAAIELTLVDDEAIEPLLRLRLAGPVEAGLHALSLEEQGIVLPPGEVHRWFAALVHDPGHRSRDELAEGAIERVDARPGSAEIATAAPTDARPAAPAETPAELRAAAVRAADAGRWYDALDALALALDRAPGDRGLAADRQALVDQAGLDLRLP